VYKYFVCNANVHSCFFVPDLSCQVPVVHLWCFVAGKIVPIVLQCHVASVFMVKQISVFGLLVPEDEGTEVL
jgi:hypothetical protein